MRFLAIIVFVACTSPAPPPPMPVPPPPPVPAELACKVDGDCLWGDLAIDVNTPDDCDCLRCRAAIVNRETSVRRTRAWNQHCKVENHVLNDRKVCPTYECLWSKLGCRRGRCVELSP
jgi:hypothetical protein